MECLTCKIRMVCVDDVNDTSIRLDFMECPKCNSKATIEYGDNGKYIEVVTWRR